MHVNYVQGKSDNAVYFAQKTGHRLLKNKDQKKFQVIHALTCQVVARRGLPYGSKSQRHGYERRCRREVIKIYRDEYKILGGGIGEMIIGIFITTVVSMLFRYLIPKIIDWLEVELSDLKSGDQNKELYAVAAVAKGLDL